MDTDAPPIGVPRESVTVPLMIWALSALTRDDAESTVKMRTTNLAGLGQRRVPLSIPRKGTVKTPSPSWVRND